MSYNAKYNTRNSGRYNSGQFVSAGELIPGTNPSRPAPAPAPVPRPAAQPPANNYGASNMQPQDQKPQGQAGQAMFMSRNQNLQMIQTQDVDMKTEPVAAAAEGEGAGDAADGAARPPWMKSKLPGVKKVTNKERRRRQNESLRRLLTPKNALMVLNEMMPGEQLASQFKVEASPAFNAHQFYNKVGQHSFCADLTLDGNTYKGYGDNKLTARNAAAEQAIRDLIIKKMVKFINDGAGAAGAGAGGEGAGGAAAAGGEAGGEEMEAEEAEGGEALPMIQLASYALHKLFSEWEFEGHKVPQLKPAPNASTSESESTGAGGAGAGAPGAGAPAAPKPPKPRAPKAAKKPRELPANAAAMHPCMLLTYMRPHLEYRELGVAGDRPQNMMFTLGVDVDGATYLGKASNKKEARKAAARAACQALFNVRFDETPAPAPAPAPAPMAH